MEAVIIIIISHVHPFPTALHAGGMRTEAGFLQEALQTRQDKTQVPRQGQQSCQSGSGRRQLQHSGQRPGGTMSPRCRADGYGQLWSVLTDSVLITLLLRHFLKYLLNVSSACCWTSGPSNFPIQYSSSAWISL